MISKAEAYFCILLLQLYCIPAFADIVSEQGFDTNIWPPQDLKL